MLIKAAAAVIRRDGAQALTLEAVAAEAGVSKGGLLYHFKSKRELLDGLVERWLDDFQHDIDKLQKMAYTDFLTGLMNRRAFLSVSDDAVEF